MNKHQKAQQKLWRDRRVQLYNEILPLFNEPITLQELLEKHPHCKPYVTAIRKFLCYDYLLKVGKRNRVSIIWLWNRNPYWEPDIEAPSRTPKNIEQGDYSVKEITKTGYIVRMDGFRPVEKEKRDKRVSAKNYASGATMSSWVYE